MDEINKVLSTEEKRIYYVTKIAKIDSQEYKLSAARMISGYFIYFTLGADIMNLPVEKSLAASCPIAIALYSYCKLLSFYNNKGRMTAIKELSVKALQPVDHSNISDDVEIGRSL